MANISVDPETLESQATVYEKACGLITEGQQAIESANSDMEGHWEGGAFDGYLNQYREVLKPAIENYNETMQACCQQLKDYAGIMRDSDQELRKQFEASIG